MEKAIDIKRRAQRCIQNGDLDGALAEYEKLVGGEESDPYNYVLLADLLYKKGDQTSAAERYLSAVAAYEKSSLFKNAIAVCKKMLRLSLSPAKVLNSLANLHLLDGLAGEAALYYVQYAEHMVRSSAPAEAAEALRKAFDACQDNLKVLEQLSEAWLLAGENPRAASVMLEAAAHYRARGQEPEAVRCTLRASQLDSSVASAEPTAAAPTGAIPSTSDAPGIAPSQFLEPTQTPRLPSVLEIGMDSPTATPSFELEHTSRSLPTVESVGPGAVEGFESGRHGFEFGDRSLDSANAAPTPPATPDDFAISESEAGATWGEAPLRAPAESAEEADAEPVYEIEEEVASDPVYEIGADDDATAGVIEIEASGADAPVFAQTEVPAEPVIDDMTAAGSVYEISSDDPSPTLEMAEPAVEEPVYEIVEDAEPVALESPEKPGLAFPADAAETRHGPSPLEHVEALLTMAQDQFRAGDRDQATATLAEAARAYELLGRYDSAATIYRSLGRGAQATPVLMEQWLTNCERRGDTHEAAQVSCELGDRALNNGDEATALDWFRRALAFDASNEMAQRRIQRLTADASGAGTGSVAVATATPAPMPFEAAPAAADATGRVEVAVGRAEAVSFDLAGLLAEFQKGVAAQLEGDSQSHYDLGMTYREMGLLDQAIESFRVAQQDSRIAPRALEMAGRCLADQGRHHEACGDYRRALAAFDPAAGDDGEIRWHLAHSLTEIGEHEEALAEYERVQESLPGYEDVAERISALRRVLGRS